MNHLSIVQYELLIFLETGCMKHEGIEWIESVTSFATLDIL